jgi:hypothetical protein
LKEGFFFFARLVAINVSVPVIDKAPFHGRFPRHEKNKKPSFKPLFRGFY